MTQLRAYDFIVGVEASAQPDAGVPVLPNDLVTLSFLEAFSERVEIIGSYAVPEELDAGDTIDPGIVDAKDFYLMFITGNGAPVELTSNPPIIAPGRAGVELTLVGVGPNSVTINNNPGAAQNGPVELTDKSAITYKAIDATTWMEKSRQ